MLENNILINNVTELDTLPDIDADAIAKAYPDVDIKGKLVLFIDFEFLIPSQYRRLCVMNERIDIDLGSYDGYQLRINLPEYKITTPLPNKRWFCLNVQEDRSVSKRGIILLFDSFESLSRVKNITVTWVIGERHCLTADTMMVMDYDLTFMPPNGNKCVYTLISRDSFLTEQKKLIGKEMLAKKYNIERYYTHIADKAYKCKQNMVIKPHAMSLLAPWQK